MKSEDLHQSLTNLHDELQRITEVDACTREAMKSVLDDLRRVIGDSPGKASALHQIEPPMASRLKVLMNSFELKHPQLSGVFQKVADQLAEMGI